MFLLSRSAVLFCVGAMSLCASTARAIRPATPSPIPAATATDPPSALETKSSREIAASSMPSVVTVFCDESQGSGFFIADDLVVTNVHVIRDCEDSVMFKPAKEKAIFALSGIVAFSIDDDLAILKVDSDLGKGKPLQLSDRTTPPATGERVYVIGSPKGLEATFTEGLVSALRGDEQELIQVNAAVAPGSSGGPVLSEQGEVIGVIVGGMKDTQGLNFAVNAARLKTLIDRPRGKPAKPGDVRKAIAQARNNNDNNDNDTSTAATKASDPSSSATSGSSKSSSSNACLWWGLGIGGGITALVVLPTLLTFGVMGAVCGLPACATCASAGASSGAATLSLLALSSAAVLAGGGSAGAAYLNAPGAVSEANAGPLAVAVGGAFVGAVALGAVGASGLLFAMEEPALDLDVAAPPVAQDLRSSLPTTPSLSTSETFAY